MGEGKAEGIGRKVQRWMKGKYRTVNEDSASLVYLRTNKFYGKSGWAVITIFLIVFK